MIATRSFSGELFSYAKGDTLEGTPAQLAHWLEIGYGKLEDGEAPPKAAVETAEKNPTVETASLNTGKRKR